MEIFFSPKSNAQKNTKILSSQIIWQKNGIVSIMVTPRFLKDFFGNPFSFFSKWTKINVQK
jgi:hypothetical protein